MAKVQPTTDNVSKPQQKRMYRGVLATQAVVDVFVRATSNAAANQAIQAGKGQRMRPRFGTWKLSQEAVAVEAYTASSTPIQEFSTSAIGEKDLEKVYADVLQNISVLRRGEYSDRRRQAMVDAVGEFYELLTVAIRAKVGGKQESS